MAVRFLPKQSPGTSAISQSQSLDFVTIVIVINVVIGGLVWRT